MKRRLFAAIPYVLLTAVLTALLLFPKGSEAPASSKTIVKVWNIDTFEGGKGSRTAFLAKAARRVESENEGVYYFVTDYTREGALDAISKGELPDAVSFGIGFSALLERSLPIPYTFAGGEVAGKCLAVPWCRGRYLLFSKDDDFEEEGKTAISHGGCNLSVLAARLCGVEGEEVPSMEAYTGFLSGEYRYLLGTQRDECRFASRGESVFSKEMKGFCDLYCVVSVLSEDHFEEAHMLISELLSPRTQEALFEIGMLPAALGEGNTVSVFASDEALKELRSAALSGDGNFSEKYLKPIEKGEKLC